MIEINVNLEDLSNVDLKTQPPSDKDLLTYDHAKSMWVAKAPTAEPTTTAYLLELSRWNVKNDGTDAVNTSKGINEALVWASQQGYIEVVLPKGTYLIDENQPIEPQSYMTLNLGGSTLRIRDNGLTKYAIVSYQRNQIYSRVTNGRIEGDKDTHDYTAAPGTHEGGRGIEVGSLTPTADGGNNTRFISIDNLEILNCTGDAITVGSTFGQIFPTPAMLASSFEQGGISTTDGTLTTDPQKVRSSLTINMNQSSIVKYGYFGLYGNGYGGLGAEITTNFYDVIFYKADNSFLSAATKVQFFDEVKVPEGASYARVVLHQSHVPTSSGCTINVRVPSFTQHLYIEKCHLHDCRRQGISVSGAKHVYIRDCHIHHIQGTDPQGGIDIEDGYDLNQFIIIEGNNFHDNHGYDVVVVNGKYIFIIKNRISKVEKYVSLGINGGADKVVIAKNNFHKSKVILSGEVIFSENYVFASRIQVLGVYHKPISILHSVFHNGTMSMDNPFAYNVKVDGCRFFNDEDKMNAFSSDHLWTIELKNEPQIISNSTFEGLDIYYLSKIYPNKGGWVFENVMFKNVKNPGLPSGTYTRCQFIDIAFMGLATNVADEVEFKDCKIISMDKNNTLLTINNAKAFRFINCFIEKPDSTIIRIQNVSSEVILRGNQIRYTNDSLNRAIIQLSESFSGNLVVIEDNVFSSVKSPLGVDNQTTNNPQIIIRNNILKNVVLRNEKQERLQFNILNGVVDPYYNMPAEPTTGYYVLGQVVKNSNPTPGGYVGWICTVEGYANNQTWTASKNYTKGSRIHYGGHVYEAMNNGTSSTITPAFPAASGGTVQDNTITWKEIGLLAVFKTFGSISA